MYRAGIIEVCDKLGFKNALAKGENVYVSCPLAPYTKRHASFEDTKPSMGILIADNAPSATHCFGCGWRGTFSELILYLENWIEISAEIEEFVLKNDDFTLEGSVERIRGWEEPPTPSWKEEKVFPETTLDQFAFAVPQYVLRRGFEIDILKLWGARYDRALRRLFLPVRRVNGDLVGAVGRGVFDWVKPKYSNYWNFKKGKYLFGEHLIKGSSLIVVEGCLDAIKVYQELRRELLLDEFSAVAIMGDRPTLDQVKKLQNFGSRVIVWLDNDNAGKEGAEIVMKILGKRVQTLRMSYPDDSIKDPDEVIESGFKLSSLLQEVSI